MASAGFISNQEQAYPRVGHDLPAAMAGEGQDGGMLGQPLGIDRNEGRDTGNHQEDASVSLSFLLCLSFFMSLACRHPACEGKAMPGKGRSVPGAP